MKRFLLLPLVLLPLGLVNAQTPDSTQNAKPVDEEFTKLKGTVEGLNESYTDTKNTVDKLSKLKVGGYIQAQWQHADSNGISSAAGGNFPGSSNQRLQIRRGRLKTSYDAGTSQYVLEFEVLPSGVSMKDAEIILNEPWLKTFSLTAGLMDRPFGFEIPYSSSAHEAPERTRVYQTVFPGEKDLGVKLEMNPGDDMGFLKYFNLKGGLYTGTAGGSTPTNPVSLTSTKLVVKDSLGKAIKDTVTANIPNGKTAAASNGDEVDSTMDFIGRIGFKAPFQELGLAIDGGYSVYLGQSMSGNDTVYQLSGTNSLATTGNKNKKFDRQVFGADLQAYYDLPYVGGLSIRGEYLMGTMPGTIASSKNYGSSGAAVGNDFPKSYMVMRNFSGWYVSWIQNLGSKFQTVVKYDVYDPNSDVKGSAVGLAANGALNEQDLQYQTLGMGLIYYWDANVKITAYYDMVTNEKTNSATPDFLDAPTNKKPNSLALYKKDLSDNVFTLRLQVKF